MKPSCNTWKLNENAIKLLRKTEERFVVKIFITSVHIFNQSSLIEYKIRKKNNLLFLGYRLHLPSC